MTQITSHQAAALKIKVFNLLMENPDLDMDAMSDASQAAILLVDEWIKEEKITVTE